MAKHGKKKLAARIAPDPAVDARQGLAAFERGDYAEAIQCWRRARSARPSPGLARALAEAHFRRGLGASPARRVQELQEAVALVPDRAVYHYHLGLAYQRQGQDRRAVAAYEEAHRLAPNDERVRCHLALLLLADPATSARAGDVLTAGPATSEQAGRLQALARLRAGEASAAVAGLAARRSPSPLAHLALGLAQLAANRVDEAEAALTRVQRSRRPLAAEARQLAAIGAALVALRRGDADRARTLLLRQTRPADPDLRRAFGDVSRKLAVELLLAERLEESIAAWGLAIDAAPGDEVVRRCRLHLLEVAGMQAVQRGDLAGGIGFWEAALVDEPNHGWLLRNLALAEERLERWSAASAHWERLARQWKKELSATRDREAGAELRHRLEAAYRHLAGTCEAAGDVRAAATTLERAVNLDPSDVALRLRVAELYLANEDAGRAIEHFRRVLPTRSNDARIYLDLGSAYDLKGDDRQAQTYLEQALALEPENAAIRSTLASVLHGRAHRLDRSGLGERAIAAYEQAMELAPTDPEHPQCLGEIFLKLGRRDDAARAFDRALALRPGDHRIRVAIGRIYLAHEDEKEAERYFRQAQRLDRGLVTQLAIGLAYLVQKKAAQAERYFKRVLKGREPSLLVLIGTALIDAGSADAAVPYLERAIALDPRNAEARLALAFAYAFGRHDRERAAGELDQAERLAAAWGDPELARTIDVARAANEAWTDVEPVAGGRRRAGR